jgi:hypothetical protein
VALQQNETFNLFKNEFAIFDEDDMTVGNRAENNVKDLYTLSDMRHSKARSLSCIDWLPGSTTSVGVSCASALSYDQRITVSGKVARSHILVWTMSDLITPQLVLEAPGDIFCFRFNPHRPELVVAGLVTGQVALWDLTEVRAQIRDREIAKALREGSQLLHSVLSCPRCRLRPSCALENVCRMFHVCARVLWWVTRRCMQLAKGGRSIQRRIPKSTRPRPAPCPFNHWCVLLVGAVLVVETFGKGTHGALIGIVVRVRVRGHVRASRYCATLRRVIPKW